MSAIKDFLIYNYQFREKLKAVMRPYDFANLLRACNMKPREHEKRTYLTPMNELFFTAELYPIIDRANIKIIVLGMNLVKMQIQLGISDESWNDTIYNDHVSVLAIIIYADKMMSIHADNILKCTRYNSNIDIKFAHICASNRIMFSDNLCITDEEFQHLRPVVPGSSHADEFPTLSRAIDAATIYDVVTRPYNAFAATYTYENMVLNSIIEPYSNVYGITYNTCYVTSSGREIEVNTVHSKDMTISTYSSQVGRWNNLIIIYDFVDLSSILNEVIATGISIPFSFSSF